jgi:hypothetical protein
MKAAPGPKICQEGGGKAREKGEKAAFSGEKTPIFRQKRVIFRGLWLLDNQQKEKLSD